MDKHYEAVKEILEDQIKKIVKKGDITPAELDSLYKASAICLDFETKEAMKKAEEQQKQGGQSQQGSNTSNGGYSQRGGSNESRQSGEGGQSNHFPWFMYAYEGGSNRGGNSGNSYAPIWNQEEEMMSNARGGSNQGGSNRGGSQEMSNARGRGGSRESRESRESYEGAYAGAYEGAYEGAYDGSSEEGSYRRGRNQRTGRYMSRDRGYSRAMDKERMIGKLEDMMDDAPSEKERRVLEQCVAKLENQ